MRFSKGVTLVLCLLVVTVFVAATFAQETTAGLQGTVKDPQGAVVSKAVVEVTSPSMIGAKKLETDSSGYYRFANLPPGTYTITVTAPGFRTLKQSGLRLEVGKLPSIDLALQVGGTEQTVEVSSVAPLVDVTQSKVAVTVTSDEIEGMPKGRSFQSIISFAPGARQEPLMGNGYQIDGASNAENAYLIEGQDTGNVQTGVSAANAPFEFVQEVQVKSGGFEAEYGGALGGVVNVIQKRGSNAWHGSVFTYYQGDIFNAAPNHYLRGVPGDSFDSDTRTDGSVEYIQPKKDSRRILEPGFEVGGYLKKDRLWLFTSFVPQIDSRSRTINWNYAGASDGTGAVSGPRMFTLDTKTYYALSRLDYLVNSKIRVYGAWQDQYQTVFGNNQAGTAFPAADNAYGAALQNQGDCAGAPCPTSNSSATQNPDNFAHSIGYKMPNVIYNTGADVTLTPNLVATSRFGYFYTDAQDRGLPVGTWYYWAFDPTGKTQLPTGATSYGYTGGSALPGSAFHPAGYGNISNNFTTLFDKYWRKSFNQDIAYFKKGFLGTHNIKGGYALNKLSNDVNEGYNTGRVRVSYGRYATVGVGNANTANCVAVNQYNNANYGTNLSTDPSVVDRCGGLYGTVNLRDFSTTGKVGSNNHALYLQDAWTVGKGITLNLGIRADKEDLPNYASGLPGFKGIGWGFGEKLAPRLGGSWDVLRNGKMKLYGSFGYFYDIMKYELPRGSFGGDYWHDCIYVLDTPDVTTVVPQKQTVAGGKTVFCSPDAGAFGTGIGNSARPNDGFIANFDFRKPSNDPSDLRVDPNLKPMKQHESTVGADWAVTPILGLETRWTRKRLDRTIEDAGYLDATGSEPFYIVNPGQGIDKFGNVPLTDCPVGECDAQPNAVRNYDAVEFRLTKRASDKWFGVVSYTWSRLYGNYGGLTSAEVSDGGSAITPGGGRLSPNVSRSFDEPLMQFDAHGQPTFGPLPTDRPHTVKMFGYYRLKWGRMETLLGGTQFIFSGTPLSSFVNAEDNSFVPLFVEGRGKWINVHRDPSGDLVVDSITTRRTPVYSQTDFNFVQEFKVSKNNEAMRLGFEANISNLFNQHTPVAYGSSIANDDLALQPSEHVPATSVSGVDYPSYLKYGFDWVKTFNDASHGLTVSNAYGLAQTFQTGRTMRFKVKFSF
ncbi:MAG: carboxypeptidase regulatory-like domain-containing protein [Acidobacteriaceae bacterium]